MLITRLLHRFPISGMFAYWLLFPAIYVYNARTKTPRTRGIVVRDGKVLVVRNWFGRGEWSFPGGGRHRDESELTALVREIKEEVGLSIDPQLAKHIATVRLSSYRSAFDVSVYRCCELRPLREPRRSLEIIDHRWVPITDLPADFTPELATICKNL